MVPLAKNTQSKMLDEAEQRKHLGDRLRIKNNYSILTELEQYFYNQCMRRRISVSYDCTAGEPLYFKTLNYTTYAGLFYMHPLQPEMASYQISAAMAHTGPIVDFEGFVLDSYKSKTANKYDFASRSSFKESCSELVVLPGTNKLQSNVCLNKLIWIAKKYPNAVFKPHPLTHESVIAELKARLPDGAKIAPYDADVYELMDQADIVFTSHMSESALYAVLLGKQVEPIDVFQERAIGSFAALNYHLFMGQGKGWVNKTFSSPFSGIVHPDLDEDWKQKIDEYLDYILNLRERVKTHYIT